MSKKPAKPSKSATRLQLGRAVEWPTTPDEAKLDRVPNPQRDTDYLVRFTAPEFTSLCPVTGQPDFAHLVIDYVPGQWLLESKSLKLYVASFRNHGAFHEDCTVVIGKRIAARDQAEMAAHRRLLVSARRHSDRRVLADRQIAEGDVDSRSGRRALSRARLGLYVGSRGRIRRPGRGRSSRAQARPSATITAAAVSKVGILPTFWRPKP